MRWTHRRTLGHVGIAVARNPAGIKKVREVRRRVSAMDYDEIDGSLASDLPAFHLAPSGAGESGFDATAIDADAGQSAPYGGGDGTDGSAELYVPEMIQRFVVYFHKQVRERNVTEVHFIYENTYHKLTDRFYKTSPWPPAEAIAPLVDEDPTFVMLYKELYYRHIYAKLQPTLDQRFESWENYGVIFDYLLTQPPPSAAPSTALDLPNQWLWDIVDEYIYQFQDFCRWRSRLKTKTADELDQLRENDQLYSPVTVLRTLQKVVARSGVLGALAADGSCSAAAAEHVAKVAAGGVPPKGEADGAYAASNLYRMLGYFALVGQLRVHVLLCDYRCALRCAAVIDVSKQGLFTRVTACHIAVCYYLGWAYLMSRRYVDASRALCSCLVYLQRTRAYLSRSSQVRGREEGGGGGGVRVVSPARAVAAPVGRAPRSASASARHRARAAWPCRRAGLKMRTRALSRAPRTLCACVPLRTAARAPRRSSTRCRRRTSRCLARSRCAYACARSPPLTKRSSPHSTTSSATRSHGWVAATRAHTRTSSPSRAQSSSRRARPTTRVCRRGRPSRCTSCSSRFC